MNVLLTGGTGFVGLAIAERLLQASCEVVILDRNPPTEFISQAFERYGSRLIFAEGDVRDMAQMQQVLCDHEIDTVVHAAAITPDREREINHGASVVDVNCIGTVTALTAASKAAVGKFIYISTGAIYGKGQWQLPELHEESSPAAPETYYEITKFAAERIALRYQKLTGLNVTILRLGDVFGAWEYPSGARDVMSAPFQATRLALLGQKACLPRAGKKNWVYSRDIADSVFRLLSAAELPHVIYHLSTPFRWSVADWCALLKKQYVDFSYEIVDEESRSNVVFAPDHSPMNIDRLIEDSGFAPAYDLTTAFRDYAHWRQEHRAFLRLA